MFDPAKLRSIVTATTGYGPKRSNLAAIGKRLHEL
jgi:hypothetical protein